MIIKVATVALYVYDQDWAVEFWTDRIRFEVRTVPIRLAQTHTICSGGDPKNQGFKEL
jgi:hypothetical protein